MKKLLSMTLVIIAVLALAVPALAAVQNVGARSCTARVTTDIYSSTSTSSTYKGRYNTGSTFQVKYNTGRLDWAACPSGYVQTKNLYFAKGDLGRALFHTQTLRRGDTGTAIQNLKRALNRVMNAGIDASNNSFGSGTENAIRIFQGIHGITVDGIVGANTKDTLLEALKSLDPATFHFD